MFQYWENSVHTNEWTGRAKFIAFINIAKGPLKTLRKL